MRFWPERRKMEANANARVRTRLTVKQKLARALAGSALFCSLALGAVSYAPPIPGQWVQTIREQDQVLRQVFHGETDKATLESLADQAVARVRRIPLRETAYYRYNKKTTLLGITSTMPGENLNVPYFPHSRIFLTLPKFYAHEWVHAYYGRPGNTLGTAAAVTDYFNKAFEPGTTMQRTVKNGVWAYKFGKKTPGLGPIFSTRFLRPAEVNRQFLTLDMDDHNRLFNPGMELGVWARMEEYYARKPGLGLFFIREVSHGSTVAEALEKIRSLPIEKERRLLVKNHPWMLNVGTARFKR